MLLYLPPFGRNFNVKVSAANSSPNNKFNMSIGVETDTKCRPHIPVRSYIHIQAYIAPFVGLHHAVDDNRQMSDCTSLGRKKNF